MQMVNTRLHILFLVHFMRSTHCKTIWRVTTSKNCGCFGNGTTISSSHEFIKCLQRSYKWIQTKKMLKKRLCLKLGDNNIMDNQIWNDDYLMKTLIRKAITSIRFCDNKASRSAIHSLSSRGR